MRWAVGGRFAKMRPWGKVRSDGKKWAVGARFSKCGLRSSPKRSEAMGGGGTVFENAALRSSPKRSEAMAGGGTVFENAAFGQVQSGRKQWRGGAPFSKIRPSVKSKRDGRNGRWGGGLWQCGLPTWTKQWDGDAG